jgi:polyphosphate kinase
VVELKARFDEEQNLLWASALERAGVQVVYGFIEWKTHAKMSMVVRKEDATFRTYCHLGTGNYHPVTARIYTTSATSPPIPAVGRDVAHIFNYITGYIEPKGLELISMSPQHLRATSSPSSIPRSPTPAPASPPASGPSSIAGRPGADRQTLRGEPRRRGHRAGGARHLLPAPGAAGVSDNIRVKSIVGRFLEHSRIWCFGNGAGLPNRQAKVFISSADWMPRNFDRRVEYAVPLENETVHRQVLDQVMVANIIDNEQSWRLQSDGSYVRLRPTRGEEGFNLHRYFMTNPSLSAAAPPSAPAAPGRRSCKSRGSTDRVSDKPVAIIDIGSNSVRLVVYSGATRAPSVLFTRRSWPASAAASMPPAGCRARRRRGP